MIRLAGCQGREMLKLECLVALGAPCFTHSLRRCIKHAEMPKKQVKKKIIQKLKVVKLLKIMSAAQKSWRLLGGMDRHTDEHRGVRQHKSPLQGKARLKKDFKQISVSGIHLRTLHPGSEFQVHFSFLSSKLLLQWWWNCKKNAYNGS